MLETVCEGPESPAVVCAVETNFRELRKENSWGDLQNNARAVKIVYLKIPSPLNKNVIMSL